MGLVSGYTDNLTSNIANSFEGMNTNAYDINSSVFGDDTSIGDVAMMPLKYSFSINSARMTWNGLKSVGLISSMKDPFSAVSYANRRSHSSNSMQFKGLIGDILDDVSKFGPEDKLGAIRQGFKDWGSTGRNVKGIVDSRAPGWVEKRLLNADKFHKMMETAAPEYLSAFGNKKEDAYNDYIKNVINKRSPTYTHPISNMRAMSEGKSHNPFSNGTLEHMDRVHQSKMITTKGMIKGDIGAMVSNVIGDDSITDFGNSGRKRFSLLGRKANMSRKQTMAAAYEGMKDSIVNAGGDITRPETITAMENYANGVGRALGTARKLKTAMLIGGIATAAAPLVAMTLKTAMTVPARISSTMEKLNRLDFGSGEMLQNNSIATERQRALAAIRDGQLNARSIMGNEAAFMH